MTRNLYIGSAPDPADPEFSRFDDVVLCAREYQPARHLFGRVNVVRMPFDDDPTSYPSDEELREICRTASFVAEAVRNGRRVLVTCAAGRNRSGLVVATALLKLHPQVTPGIAVDHLRSVRGLGALSNGKFVDLLSDDYCKWFENL